MRVALVSPYSWTYPGGVTRHIEALATELVRAGHEVRVFAPFDRDGRAAALRHRGARPQARTRPDWLVPLGGTVGSKARRRATCSSKGRIEDTRSVRPEVEREESHDLFVQRAPDGRIFAYVAGPQFYVVDVTDVVEGSTTGDISDNLVAFNNYINADGTVTVDGYTTGSNGHYAEPTDDGAFTYVGDEIQCGDPGIIHIFDTADLPAVDEEPRLVEEVGVLDWPTSSANQCSDRNADDASGDHPTGNNRNGETTNYARTGHNFRIYGDIMTHGAYFDGLYVWDISDPANPTLENVSNDVRYETDFRSVYARVIDDRLGADSAAILGGDFRGGPGFI